MVMVVIFEVICSGGFGEGGDGGGNDGGCGGSGIHNNFCNNRNVNLLCRQYIAC